MATTHQAVDQSLRISAKDLLDRMNSGEPMTILDVRSRKAWESNGEKIRGDIRVEPEHFRTDPSWPKDRLIAAYCT